jgi:hypothetical protein
MFDVKLGVQDALFRRRFLHLLRPLFILGRQPQRTMASRKVIIAAIALTAPD